MLRSKKKHQFLKKYCSDVKIDKNSQKKQIPLPKLKDGKTRESEFGNSAYVKRHVLNLSMLWTCVYIDLCMPLHIMYRNLWIHITYTYSSTDNFLSPTAVSD